MAEVRILSIDGGGIRGIAPLVWLHEIEKRTGKSVLSHFHLCAGTSTGALIAAGLANGEAKPAISAHEILKIYIRQAKTIFNRASNGFLATLHDLYSNKYLDTGLNRVIRASFGEAMLADLNDDIFIPAYSLKGAGSSNKNFKTWEARENPAENFPIFDVIRSTTAAPGFFTPHVFKKDDIEYEMIDGGVHTQSPALAALSHARALYGKEHDYFILSLGTGSIENDTSHYSTQKRGLIYCASNLFKKSMTGQVDAAHENLRIELGNNLMRIENSLTHQVTGLRQPDPNLDCVTLPNLEALVESGKYMVKNNAYLMDQLIEKFEDAAIPKEQLKKPVLNLQTPIIISGEGLLQPAGMN